MGGKGRLYKIRDTLAGETLEVRQGMAYSAFGFGFGLEKG
jgi:hypothetical protein